MKTRLIAVGGKMPAWVQDGYNDYAKRLPRELKLDLVELPLASRGKSQSTEQIKLREAKAIQAATPADVRRIVFDVGGRALSTEKLAKKMDAWRNLGENIAFVIGGPDGLHQTVLDEAHETWSLSALTLPHPLVRVIVVEQWYRAWTILQNHPYHK